MITEYIILAAFMTGPLQGQFGTYNDKGRGPPQVFTSLSDCKSTLLSKARPIFKEYEKQDGRAQVECVIYDKDLRTIFPQKGDVVPVKPKRAVDSNTHKNWI